MIRPNPTAVAEPVVTGFLAHGLPAWSVAGPRGSVTYLLGGSMLAFDPTWSHSAVVVDRRAGEIQAYAILSQDDQVVKLLTGHYHQLPAGPPDWPATAADWQALDTGALLEAFRRCRWYPRVDDRTGAGWAVMPVDLPPSCGIYAVGWFMHQDTAELTAREHNAFLPETTIGEHP